ncbi:MAG TPA: selenocysteine-specific translation elongation factor [Methylomirabilota bacterium]|nr:selenocysteine-specific translation elongation factor [Methylomirabilota bacterium]
MTKRFIIATAGHVDHGKSSLVKALTRSDPDRLPEEKARGITIDLGFARLALTAEHGATFEIGIVDVPGHEDLVKNMVSGVGAINAALLVVAADDLWMPQTEEHLQILSYVGIQHGVVALTKCDLAESANHLEKCISEVRDRLSGSPLADAEIIPVAAPLAHGLSELCSSLVRCLSRVEDPVDAGKPRLNVDRVFTLRGIGTVTTGSLIGGQLRRGEKLLVQPRGLPVHARSLHSHNREVEIAFPGSRVALNIPELSANSDEPHAVLRGDTITLPNLGHPVAMLDAVLARSNRSSIGKPLKPLKDGARVRWRHGTANIPATVQLLNANDLKAGESVLARFRFERPVFALEGERFVIRDWAEQRTLGGGLILHVGEPPSIRGAHLQFLETRAKQLDCFTWVRALLERDLCVPIPGLLQLSIYSEQSIQRAVNDLLNGGSVVRQGELLCTSAEWARLRDLLLNVLETYFAAHPDRNSAPLADLSAELNLERPELLDSLIASFPDLQLKELNVFRTGRKLALPDHLKIAALRVRNLLAQNGLNPPSRSELAPDKATQDALQYFLRSGEVIELAAEVVINSADYAKAVAAIVAFLDRNGPATASQIRQELQTSRRVLIPLLERLDRQGVTERMGDLRRLSRPADRAS